MCRLILGDSECNGDISTVENRIPGMRCLRVDIVGFADESFPGFVHCDFTDAKGDRHTVLEKIPVVTTENLWSDSTYPQPGMLPCERVECLHDGAGSALALVSINPIGAGYPAQFFVLESQLVNDR
jgi:hypothetical protein